MYEEKKVKIYSSACNPIGILQIYCISRSDYKLHKSTIEKWQNRERRRRWNDLCTVYLNGNKRDKTTTLCKKQNQSEVQVDGYYL